MPQDRQGTPAPRGTLVEFVRLIMVVLLAIAGFEIARRVNGSTGTAVLGIVLGSASGYVLGGVLGRQTAVAVSSVEREFRRISAAEIAAGVAGIVIALLIALLASIPLFHLPNDAAWPAVAFLYITLTYLGFRIGRGKREELFSLIGLKPRAAGVGRAEVNVLDTSALIDGRILELVRTGFLSGVLLVPQGVLGELQQIADSSDPRRRNRGRRGLDVVAKLQRDPTVDVALVEEEAMGDVDAGLVRLARDRGGAVVTADSNLASVARALSVPVRSINDLAAGLRAPVTAGEEIRVRLTREGRDHGQAVGHLDDGTMVVVEGARDHIGEDLAVTVTNVLQTTTGRMVFAVPAAVRGRTDDEDQQRERGAPAAAPHPRPRAGQVRGRPAE
jgi:uncharacterized protein YacL